MAKLRPRQRPVKLPYDMKVPLRPWILGWLRKPDGSLKPVFVGEARGRAPAIDVKRGLEETVGRRMVFRLRRSLSDALPPDFAGIVLTVGEEIYGVDELTAAAVLYNDEPPKFTTFVEDAEGVVEQLRNAVDAYMEAVRSPFTENVPAAIRSLLALLKVMGANAESAMVLLDRAHEGHAHLTWAGAQPPECPGREGDSHRCGGAVAKGERFCWTCQVLQSTRGAA